MRNLFHLFVIFFFVACNNEETTLQTIKLSKTPTATEFIAAYGNANKAAQDSHYAAYLNACKVIYDFAPTYPDMRLLYAGALMTNGKEEKAFKELSDVAMYNTPLIYERLNTDYRSEFENLDDYDSLVNISKHNTSPISNSSLAYILSEKGIIPEGVAYDNVTKTLFVSSIYKRKIIAIDSSGIISDFIPSGFEGIQGVIGMEVDAARRHLWACSGWTRMKNIPDKMDKYSGIYKFDLETGELIKKYQLKDTVDRLINDVTIHSNGTAFITESLKGKVYMIQPEKDSLELFIDSDHYYYANGITLSDSEKNLFVAHFAGVDKINLNNLEVTKLKTPENVTLGAVDGLAFYENSLIAHQSNLGGVFQYYLNEQQDSIRSSKIVESSNPYFEIPTTGEIAGDKYYYIANAQLRSFDENDVIFPDEKLDSVYILKTELTK